MYKILPENPYEGAVILSWYVYFNMNTQDWPSESGADPLLT